MAFATTFRYSNGKDVVLNEQTTDYTLTPEDNGAVVLMNKATPVNVTIPNTLTSGFHCRVVQKGAGQVSFVASSTTLNTLTGALTTPGQNSVVVVQGSGNNVTGDIFTISNVSDVASTADILTGSNNLKRVTPLGLQALVKKGADVASAGTVTFGDGAFFHVTGTTTVTALAFTTDFAGREVKVEFTGILTLTHNATSLILPTGANITTAAGDCAVFVSEGSGNFRCIDYQRASGQALGGLVSGTTTITSGTNKRVLFDDNGVVGEDASFTYDKTVPGLTVGGVTAVKQFIIRDLNTNNFAALFNASKTIADTNYSFASNGDDTRVNALSAGSVSLNTANTPKLTVTDTGTALAAGTTTLAPLKFASGINLATPTAGACEYDGVNSYFTNETTAGRGAIPVEQHFKLTSAGSTISTIANFFGATSNIPLVAGGIYEIEIFLWYLNTTAGTVTWTLTNSAAPTSQEIYYEMSPVTGIVAPPGTATQLVGHTYNDTTAAFNFTTGTLTTAVNHFARFKIFLINNTGTSLKIQATKNVGGTITPGIGSRWFCKRLAAGNVGSFAA